MAQLPLYDVENNWVATLDAAINDSVTSLVLSNSGGTGLTAGSLYLISIDDERIIGATVTADTPSAGKDTLSILTRAADGTSAAAHSAGATVSIRVLTHHFNEPNRILRATRKFLADLVGGGGGVIRTDSGDELQAVAQGSPDMTVLVKAGSAMVAGEVVALLEDTTSPTMVAPSTNPRIDVVQIDQLGNVEIKTGTEDASPSAPSVDADALKLAEIYHVTTSTHIDDSDGGDSYITDARVFV